MKTLKFNLRILLVPVVAFSFFFTACEPASVEEVAHESRVLLRGIPCEEMDVNDLDLSGGFSGSITKGVLRTDPDFIVSDYDGQFDFPPAAGGDEDCRGFCSFNVRFEPIDPNNQTDFSSLGVNGIEMTYTAGTSVVTVDVNDFAWSYPDLEIQLTVTNTTADYNIDFDDDIASELLPAEITITSGLCVVDNVDLQDPPKVMVCGGTSSNNN